MNFARTTMTVISIALALVVIPSNAIGADLISPPNPYGNESNGINVLDNWINNGRQASLIEGPTSLTPNAPKINCTRISDCNLDSLAMVTGNVLLPNCEDEGDRNCVEGVALQMGNGFVIGESLGESSAPEILESEQLNLPEGSGLGRWLIPATSQSPEIRIATHADLNMNYIRSQKPFAHSAIAVTAIPYVDKSGTFSVPKHTYFTDTNGVKRISTVAPPPECAWVTESACGQMVDLDQNLTLRLSLRVSSSLGGWLVGRVSDPSVEVDSIGRDYSRIQVTGKAAVVPKIYVSVPKPLGEKEAREAFNNWYPGSNVNHIRANDEHAIKVISAFRDLAQDSTIGDYTIWHFASIQTGGRCSDSGEGFNGFVSTNASVYQPNPPAFTGSLFEYVVAGYHFKSDGVTENIGRYDLVMRSDYARCLYGFSNAPLSAQVQVLSGAGQEVVATTVVSEKDGWLKLAAYGFTFSEKEIKVKITQPQIRTLSLYSGQATALTSAQKAQITATLAKSDGNTKFICTGIRYFDQPVSENILVRKRAKLACDYAKSLRPDLSYWFQTKTTKARSYNGRVLVVSK
jgi:hypothetical protein